MSKVITNQQLSKDFYMIRVEQENNAAMGQFYMLRAWEKYPVLSRPISVFDADSSTVSFLYKVVGEGTEIFAGLQPGDDITLQGPYGSTFPQVEGKIAMVGGGVGIAPLYLTSKTLKKQNPSSTVDIFLGFSDKALLLDEYQAVCDHLEVDVGGFVTDKITPENYDVILTCGPTIMMKVLFDKCEKAGVADRLYVSLENRMACGIGACLVCSCKTASGNKKVCKDGPVFPAKEVFGV